MDSVTVVTLTRKRIPLLKRAINSVRAQDYPGAIHHLILVDNCPASKEFLASLPTYPNRPLIALEPPSSIHPEAAFGDTVSSVYPRIARMTNFGVSTAQSEWVALLDDDNEFESNHVSSLLTCASRSKCDAVHAGRKVYNADGTPYLIQQFPWAVTLSDRVRIYSLLCTRGVWARGTNVLLDRAGPAGLGPFRNSTVVRDHDAIFLVDTSVWLIRRTLLLEIPIPSIFSAVDLADSTAPDDKLLAAFLEAGVRIAATGLPTLRYYLGGISN